MSDAIELERLAALHAQGALNDDEFGRAKARVLGGQAAGLPPIAQSVNGFRRSRSDRWIGGVCGGLERATGLASWGWRILFVLGLLWGGCGLGLYLLLWLLVPSE